MLIFYVNIKFYDTNVYSNNIRNTSIAYGYNFQENEKLMLKHLNKNMLS